MWFPFGGFAVKREAFVNEDVKQGAAVGGVDTLAGFRSAMAEVDRRGWESQSGVWLLSYARCRVVEPLVVQRRLYGDGRDDATSAGWLAAWDALRSSAMRSSPSPWGLVRAAANHGIQGAYVAQIYKTTPRTAWRRYAAGRTPEPVADNTPLSLEHEMENGNDFPEPAVATGLGERLESICAALVAVGWERRSAEDALAWIAANYSGFSRGPRKAVHRSIRQARTPAGDLVDVATIVGDPWGYPSLRCPSCEAGVVAGCASALRQPRGTRPFIRLRSGHSHADECEYAPSGAVRGSKFAADRLHIPEWQLRRLALVVGGGDQHVGLLELMTLRGHGLLRDQVAHRSIRATASRRAVCPSSALGAQYGSGQRSRRTAV